MNPRDIAGERKKKQQKKTKTKNSHLKEFKGMKSEPVLTPREKSPLPEAQRRVELVTLHHAGQRAQHTTKWAIQAPER